MYMENIDRFTINNNDNDFSESFKNYIYEDIDYIFPLLNSTEKDLIKEMMMSLLTLIYYKFHFESQVDFLNKLTHKNNQDIRMILLLLLPYIDDKNNFEIHKNIINLKDLSVKKTNDEYVTNIQYDRYFESNKLDTPIYEYNILDVYNNYIASYYTINRCAHHLYCNWYQIIPLTLTNYTESYIYKDTIDTINEQQIPNNTSLKGLDVRDYYHSFANDMVYDILAYKWLLYEKYENGKDTMYLETILKYFNNGEELIFNFTTQELHDYNQNNFTSKWTGFITQNTKDIIFNILLHFDAQSEKYISDELRDAKISKIIPGINIIEYLDDNDTIINRLPKDELYDQLLNKYNNLDYYKYIYLYLCDTFVNFSRTWYGKMIFPNKKYGIKHIIYLKDLVINKTKIFNNPIYSNSYISYKNIYNFAKNLITINYSNTKKIHEWDALSNEEKDIILKRLNSKSSDWFNISNNLRIKYSDINTTPIKNKIFALISNNLTDIVFHSLVSRGLLNEFKVKHKREMIEKSFDGYYFLTQTKYTELDIYYKSEKDVSPTSFKLDKMENPITFFALDWLQQIHFFKHFFHQRVTYVTGGTGVGKSTQIPKLLLYGLYLNGNYNGRVINTQPRINATTTNANTISTQLGVPLSVYDKQEKKEKKTPNYYVQYSTGGISEDAKHDPMLDNQSELNSYLKIVTDGTLLNVVKKSPFLLKTYKENKELKEIDVNSYDIISIDEAHEHNPNMDLLLTFLRDTVQLNNSLRLVIITATIESDEPIYRRYYKYINDNLLYPLNNLLFTERNTYGYFNVEILTKIREKFPGLIDNLLNGRFDRRSVDRRLHISAPLSTTLYKITDVYEKKDVIKYEDAEKLAIQKAIELTKVATGDILLFSITEPAINRIVLELNNNPSISSNWIVLPYYSKLSKKWKDIIENINIKKSVIDVDRRDTLLATINADYRKVDPNTYTKVIIVATNVAEASITIDTLKYVIDTGFENSVVFDPLLGIEKNGPEYITETSRIQRRGRVGRVSSGTVYYMYKEGARKEKKNNYKITQSINTLVFTLIDFIKKGYILSKDNTEIKEELILSDNQYDNLFKLYNQFIKSQYTYNLDNVLFNDPYIEYSVFNGNPRLCNNIINPKNIVYSYKYKSGYDYENIIDFTGDFYIIHPLENNYTRDKLTGKFINFDKKIIKRFEKYFGDLFKLRLVTINNNNVIQTKIYDILDELKENISNIIPNNDINYNILLSLILGSRYNLLDEVIWINIILKESSIKDLSMKITTKKGYEISDNTVLLKYFGDKTSDLNVYVKIFKKIKLALPRLSIMNPDTIINEFDNYRFNNSSKLSSEITSILKNYESKDEEKRKLLCIYENETDIDEVRIKSCCEQYGLDHNEIMRLIKIYFRNHTLVNIVNNWVEKYKSYIPYFENNQTIDFIYISSYVERIISNIDDRTDYKTSTLDPFSIVTGNKIFGIKKENKENKEKKDMSITLSHLISYNEILHLPAIVPAIIDPLENNLFRWQEKYIFYMNLTPDIIEKYLLHETDKKVDNIRNKLYNKRLLNLFRLVREKLKN